VPFVRFARDKRGYEHTYLVHESGPRGRPASARVLYWYRTPPGVKVGRAPFDDDVRRRLEAQHPGIKFDWRAITSAQPPPPDVEHWRERRRAEKAAKQARLSDERAGAADEAALVDEPAAELASPTPQEVTASPIDAAPAEADPGAPKRRRRRGGRRRRAAGDAPITASGATAPGPKSAESAADSVAETSEE
jgi:hypothetical protein